MGGQIGLESQMGQGSKFWFELPLKLASTTETAAITESEMILQVPAVDEPDAVSSTLLVVDDNPVSQKLAVLQLKQLGYVAKAVSNGREAVEAVSNGNFALVFMDCHMPEMDGFEATSAIRRQESTNGRHLPIVGLTAQAMAGDRQRCLAVGMDDYLSKPVLLEKLATVLKQWVNSGTAGKNS